MANKDFYDRIADALEIISGDSSHVDDIDKNMDYYSRIADALENIAENGGGGGGSSGGVMIVQMEDDNSSSNTVLKKTFQEIQDAFLSGYSIILHRPSYGNPDDPKLGQFLSIHQIQVQNGYYYLWSDTQTRFQAASPSDYPYIRND